jgi:hypothetical protein
MQAANYATVVTPPAGGPLIILGTRLGLLVLPAADVANSTAGDILAAPARIAIP